MILVYFLLIWAIVFLGLSYHKGIPFYCLTRGVKKLSLGSMPGEVFMTHHGERGKRQRRTSNLSSNVLFLSYQCIPASFLNLID